MDDRIHSHHSYLDAHVIAIFRSSQFRVGYHKATLSSAQIQSSRPTESIMNFRYGSFFVTARISLGLRKIKGSRANQVDSWLDPSIITTLVVSLSLSLRSFTGLRLIIVSIARIQGGDGVVSLTPPLRLLCHQNDCLPY
jgi:hypothetical protein